MKVNFSWYFNHVEKFSKITLISHSLTSTYWFMWLLRSMLDPLAFRYCMTSSWLALKQPSKNERTPSSPFWHSWQMAFVNSSSSAICKCQNIISNVIIVCKSYCLYFSLYIQYTYVDVLYFLANFYFICKVKYI